MMWTRRRTLSAALAVLVGLAVAGWYRWGREDDPALPFTTALVTRGDVVETVSATGTLQAVTTVQVGTQVSGTIKALHADFNSRVRKGQVIAELEPSIFQSEVEQARASLLRLQSDVDRARVQAQDAAAKLARAEALAAQQLIAATDLETARATASSANAAVKSAEAQVVQAQASLRQAQVNLGHTIIRAPIDGVVVSRNVDVGQTVAASMQAPTLFVIAQDLTEMQVNASIDEADIGRIESGQPVSFRVDAFPGQMFAGEVVQVRLNPVVEQNVVSYVTVIRVPNPELQLKPGMTASVTVEVARADDTLRVPAAALRYRPSEELLARFGNPGGNPADTAGGATPDVLPARNAPTGTRRGQAAGVWIFDGQRLREADVRPGISDGAYTAVTGDIAEGEQVVVNASVGPAAAPAAPTTSPLIPQRPGRGGAAAQRSRTTGGTR